MFTSSQRALALALRIVRQFLRDRRTLALLFVAPLVIMTVLNFVLGSSSSSLTLALVAPTGAGGATITQEIRSTLSKSKGVQVIAINADQVDAKLKSGDANAALIFPPDFVTTLASGGQPHVTLRLDGSNPPAAQQAQQLVTFALAALSAPSARSASLSGGQLPSVAPVALDTTYLYGGPEYTETDALAPMFVGLFSFFFVFLLASVAFLRERSQGTLERVLVSPLSRTELTLGYVLGFTLFATIQSLVILGFVIYVLQVHYAGNLWLLFLITLTLTIGGVNMGIFASAFARNELQVVQFIPLLIVPQILLGGLFFPVNTLPVILKQAAYVMPLTWANFALKDVMLKGLQLSDIWPDVLFLLGFATLMVIGAALSLRQERA
ncbi:MAG TPA: ABC transporter permease [Ktedonobacterales bacterium]|jgi:ABC-2 type transport system permease protein|nr:ABC transporter permease [Ktedonobacterales bacterium]